MRLAGALAVSVLVLSLGGCTTIEQKPLSYTVNATRDETRAALVAGFSSKAFMVLADTENTLTVQRPQTPGDMVFSNNLKISYQFVVTGDKPATIAPRIIATFGANFNAAQTDVTHRGDLRAELEAHMQPIISGLNARP